MLGPSVTHYQVLEKLGEGGMSEVYKARDLRLRRHVALKVLLPPFGADPDRRARFEREAWAASALDHPNVGAVYEIDETADGRLFLALGYYDAQTLRQRLDDGPLDVEAALAVARQLGAALVAAHAKGVVHRDVKPANVLVTDAGTVKLIDFGIAKLKEPDAFTTDGLVLGSLPYMSPEQTRGVEVDARTDVWAFGVVLYEMLAGQRPFDCPYDAALQYQIQHEPPPPLRALRPDVPAWLEAVVARCLEKAPTARYGDMQAVLDALAAEAPPPDTPPPEAPSANAARPNRTPRRAALALLAAGALGVLLAAWAFTKPALPDGAGTDDPAAWADFEEGRERVRAYQNPAEIDAAIAAFQRAVARDSVFAPAHAGLGDAYALKAALLSDTAWAAPARQHARRALRLDPPAARPHVTLGRLALGAGDPRAALARFRRALAADSTDGAVWLALGDGYLALGEVAAAERAYEQAVRLEPDYWAGYNKLGVLHFTTGAYGQAAQDFEAALEADPGNMTLLDNQVGAHFLAGQFEQAEQAYLRLLAMRPGANVHANLGTVYYYQSDYEKAVDHYARALQHDPDDYTTLGFLASSLLRIPGREAEARNAYRRAITALERTPGWRANPVATSELATYYVSIGESERALDLVQRVTSPAPSDVDVVVNAAAVFAAVSDTVQARRWLCEALAMGFPPALLIQNPVFSKVYSGIAASEVCIQSEKF